MKKIDEKYFEKKLAESSTDIAMFISELYVDETLEQMVGDDVEDYLVIVNDLANQISYYVLGLLSLQEFKDNLAEVLYLDNAVDIQKAYDAINRFVLSKLNKKDKTREDSLEEAKLAASGHISHIDLLNEIENPTPSMSTTTDFQNSPKKVTVESTISTPATSGATNNSTNNISPVSKLANSPLTQPDSSIHSSAPTTTYTNPALNIATKLSQNLGAPSASIPKDIYVSKKPDPYHEPVM